MGRPRTHELSHAQRAEMAHVMRVQSIFDELHCPFDTLRIGSWNLHTLGAGVSTARLHRLADVLVSLQCQVVLLQGVTGGRETFWRLVTAMNTIDRVRPIQPLVYASTTSTRAPSGATATTAAAERSSQTSTGKGAVQTETGKIAEACFHGEDAEADDGALRPGATVSPHSLTSSPLGTAVAAGTSEAPESPGSPVTPDSDESSDPGDADGSYDMLNEPTGLSHSGDLAASDEEASDEAGAWRADEPSMGAWRGVTDGVEFGVVWRDGGLAEQGTHVARVRGVFTGINGASLRGLFVHPVEYKFAEDPAAGGTGAAPEALPPAGGHFVPVPAHVYGALGFTDRTNDVARTIPFRAHAHVGILARTPMWVLLDTRHSTGVRRQVLLFNVNLRYTDPAELDSSLLNVASLRPSKYTRVATLMAGVFNVDRIAGARQRFLQVTLKRDAPHYLACNTEPWTAALSVDAPTNLYVPQRHPYSEGNTKSSSSSSGSMGPAGMRRSVSSGMTAPSTGVDTRGVPSSDTRTPRMLDNVLFLKSQWHVPVRAFASRIPYAFAGLPAGGSGPGFPVPADSHDALERQLSTHRPICFDLRSQPADTFVTLAPQPMW